MHFPPRRRGGWHGPRDHSLASPDVSPLGIHALPIAFVLAGCHASSSTPGVVVFGEGVARDAVLVQPAHRWPSQARSPAVKIDEAGRFALPEGVGAVDAFVDANANGQLDRYQEPSVHCTLQANRWTCPLTRTRLTVHRVQSGRIRHGRSETFSDSATIVAEQYDAEGRPDLDVRFCLYDDADACAGVGANPFAPRGNGAQAISPCMLQASLSDDRELFVTTRGLRGGESRIPLTMPRALGIVIEVVDDGEEFRMTGQADMEITHAIAWVGSKQADRIEWSTEQYPQTLRVTGTLIDVDVPSQIVAACAECKLMLQVAHVRDGATVGAYSETMLFLDREASP